jgi:serine/threonine-protein kinase HipA
MEILLGSDSAEIDRHRFFKTQLVFWLLAATDGHAKNLSIFHLPRSRFRATPLYDVLSAHPIIGTGANRLAPQRAKLAMAIRGTENYYHIQRVQRRHWLSQAKTVGLGAAVAERLIEDILASVQGVVAAVSRQIPEGFPVDLADTIFSGLLSQHDRLKRMT